MSTPMNKENQHPKSTVGLLLLIGDIISNEQRDEVCLYLIKALKYIDNNKYHEVNDLFNNLIPENEFPTDSQYRQIANTENGSTAGFLYLPSFHTLFNVLQDIFSSCYHVCIVFCGQQTDSNGAMILSDSAFTADNFHSLFEENTSYLTQDLQIILPFVSNQWTKLSNNYLQKRLENVQFSDVSSESNQEKNSFGQRFYERLTEVLNDDAVNFDISAKLIPRDSSGTIAFDEPNLYILYGQQGEASLFGIRGFVVLINGGYSRIPSYWNLIRGLQTIDACILTHFDYDVFPGLQTILHRKRTPALQDNQSSKPDIGAMFLNHTQRTKLQSTPAGKPASTSKLLVNLTENIDQFLNNIKQLNIDTFNLIKHNASKQQSIEPINLYRKIAFGSLDLYVLHPTTSGSEDDKVINTLQKIPIRNQQVSSSIIPHHHWYSSCLLLVWTPSSKSNKDHLVRILYTGACPQTLVFEALSRVRQLEFLHGFEQQTSHATNAKTPPHTSAVVKHSPQKSIVSPPVMNRVVPSAVQHKTATTTKATPHPNISKPKVSQTKMMKSEKPLQVLTSKKTPTSIASSSNRSISKEKKTQKSHGSLSKPSSKAKPVKSHTSQLKTATDQKHNRKVLDKPKKELDTRHDHKQEQEILNGHGAEEADIHSDQERRQEVQSDNEQVLESQSEQQEDSIIENEIEQTVETDIDDEQTLESHTNDYEQSDENEQSFANENDEQQFSADELNDNNELSLDNREDESERPESISLTTNHNESFVVSNSAAPIDETKSQLSPQDSMTTTFADGAPDKENSFTEKLDEYDDDEMEIIHHDMSASIKHPMPSTEDIHPQGLPIDKDAYSKKPTMKKLSNGSNRTNGSATSVNNTNQASSRQSQQKSSLDSIFNIDVAYIPYHGNEHYVDSEFFRRVRARYYILNAVQISRLTLESLLDGIQQWNNKECVPVTLVPTFDGEQLRAFFVTNKDRLAKLNINILPAATRCNVQYDHEGSPAQLLRFNSIYNADEQ